MEILGISIGDLTDEIVAQKANEFYDANASAENVKWRKDHNLQYEGPMEPIIYSVFDMCNNFQTDQNWNDSKEQGAFKFEAFKAMF